ncbi:MAG: hypothetical protein RQ736_03215 [Thiogranum sp.]|nr:hypothetical protein [Thiogranum sp.]
MDILVIILLCAMEAALLLGIAVVLLKRKNVHLQQQLETAAKQAQPDDEFESISSGYLPYLERQIIDTRSQQQFQATSEEVDERLAEALNRRLDLLEAEKKVTEYCNDYPERRWEHVAAHYSEPQLEEEAPQIESPAASADIPESEKGQVEQLVSAFDQQGSALSSLRAVFEQAKQQPDTAAFAELETQLKELERRFDEATTCVEIMEQENHRLQHQMEREEQQAERERHENAAEFSHQLGKQKQNISALYDMVGELQLEAEKATALHAQLDQFENNAREMSLCIETMEEENLFLRNQVEALQSLDRTKSEQEQATAGEANEAAARRIESLQAELEAKQKSMEELQMRFAEVEKEYLLLYEKTRSV